MTQDYEEYTMTAKSTLAYFLSELGMDLQDFQLPPIAALAFQDDGLGELCSRSNASPIGNWNFPGTNDPLYLGKYQEVDVIIGKIPEGAPKAAIFIEFLLCLGVNRIIVTGAAGSLQPEVPGCSLVATTSAIREEGTSYHYLDASEVAQASQDLLQRLHQAAIRAGIKIHSGPTLTNDAPFRIPISKIKHYQKLNVLTAEMELSALFAVAQCRGIDLAGLLVISDTHYGDREIVAFSEGYLQAQRQAARIILDALCKIQP